MGTTSDILITTVCHHITSHHIRSVIACHATSHHVTLVAVQHTIARRKCSDTLWHGVAPAGVRIEQPAGFEPLTGQPAQPHGVRSSQAIAHTALSTAWHAHRRRSAAVTDQAGKNKGEVSDPLV